MLVLRVPTGWFFTILGVLLLGMGIFQPEARAALTDVNIKLYCGLTGAFGVFLLKLARRAARRHP